MTRTVGRAFGVAVSGVVVSALYAVHDPRRAALAWLVAFASALTAVLGVLVLVMILDVVGARWSLVLRPRMTAVAGLLPVFGVLFLPVLFSLDLLYPWAKATEGLEAGLRSTVEHQRAWNHPSAFVGRSVVYLVTWSILGLTVRRSSRASAGGLPLMALTLTFASFDWLMSLEAGWQSTMYGVYVFAGGLISAIALVIVLAWMNRRVGMPLRPAHVHALGRLLFMAVMFWAYIGFFQFLLIWITNLPHEVGFYVARSKGSMAFVSVLLVVGRFVLPFLALLSRSLKRSAGALVVLAVWLLAMQVLDVWWLVVPASGDGARPLDIAPVLAVFGLVITAFVWRYPSREGPLEIDPVVVESLGYESP